MIRIYTSHLLPYPHLAHPELRVMLTTTAVACAGFADYGVNVNPSKTRLSFEMVTSSGTKLQVICHHDVIS